jgi:hypothetical protein
MHMLLLRGDDLPHRAHKDALYPPVKEIYSDTIAMKTQQGAPSTTGFVTFAQPADFASLMTHSGPTGCLQPPLAYDLSQMPIGTNLLIHESVYIL